MATTTLDQGAMRALMGVDGRDLPSLPVADFHGLIGAVI